MKQYLKIALVLFLICAVSALLLGFINEITAPVIKQNVQRETKEALEKISGGYSLGEKSAGKDNIGYVINLTQDGDIKGYILEVKANGYGGQLTILASYNLDGSIISAKMMANSETPGLGKKSEESWYMQMFTSLGAERPIPASKGDLENPDLVSGASITFNGVSNALRSGSEYVKSLGGK